MDKITKLTAEAQNKEPTKSKGVIAVTPNALTENFKGQVNDVDVKFPKELGAEHPFEFDLAEGLYKTFPFVKGAIDKHADYIVSDFSVKVKDKNAQALVDSFIIDKNFQVTLRNWVLSALLTGNGFMELDLENTEVQNLDPTQMFVDRDKNGNIKGYNQFKGLLSNFGNRGTINKAIPFKPNQIAHLKINTLPGEPYGQGLVSPNFKVIQNYIKGDQDMHKVLSRKAGMPIHVKVGVEGEAVDPGAITDFNEKLEFLNNRTEWVTDANVKMSVLEFGNTGDKFINILESDIQQLLFGFQVPAVLMGIAKIPEGLAKVQLEAFQRRIKSFQEAIEKVIEETILKPFLVANGLDSPTEVLWNLPGETEINNRVDKLSKILNNSTNIDENMRRLVQIDLALTLDLDEATKFLRKPEVGLDDQKEQEEKQAVQDELDRKAKEEEPENPERKEEETEIGQPEVPGAKPSAKAENLITEEHKHMPGCGCGQQLNESLSGDMTVKEWLDLKEIEGFNYTDYLAATLEALKKDKFKQLAATNKEQVALGLLTKEQVERLRIILKDGFQKNKVIKQIQNEINSFVGLTDRFDIKDGAKVLTMKAPARANAIARTETVRLASKGLLDVYKENDIKKVSFLAALSDRTCPVCEGLDAKIFTINEAQGVIPVHTACRCSWVSIVE